MEKSREEWQEIFRKGEEERKAYLESLENAPKVPSPKTTRARGRPLKVFTQSDYDWIYKLRCDGASILSIAVEFGSSTATISRVLKEMDKEGETKIRASRYSSYTKE
jgi:hypothetical protein